MPLAKKLRDPLVTSSFKNLVGVNSALLRKLQDSGLDKSDAKILRLEPFTANDVAEKMGALSVYKAGMKIPYFDFDGTPTGFWRFRFLEETKSGFAVLTKKKSLRYTQLPNSESEIYLPPTVDWKIVSKDFSTPLVITEGELKAACACKFGFNCLGLGGVWSFRSAKSGKPFLDQLQKIVWKDRVVYICYDSDAITNQKVLSAENKLASELLRHGAKPSIIRLPSKVDGLKNGLDDFIVEEGVDAFSYLLDNAADWTAAKELHLLNEEVVYVEDPGLILRLDNFQRMAPRAFVDHAYAPRIYYEIQATEKGTKLVERSAPREWLKWPGRASTKRVVYSPGEDLVTSAGELNIWQGWGCEPVKGDISLWHKLIEHLFSGAAPEIVRWFEQWLAYPLQHPGTKLYAAPVLWGRMHGTGKSLIGYTMFEIYGVNGTEIEDRDLESAHNEWAENKQFVMGDEIAGGDKRAVADRMKSRITRQLLRLNPKYVPSYTVVDCINYYFTSNHPDSFFLEDDDRRFFIWEVLNKPKEREFYNEYKSWMLKAGGDPHRLGPSALFYYLLTLDLVGFDPAAPPPFTASKQDMIDNGRSDLGGWVAALREDPDNILRMGNVTLPYALWKSEQLLDIYDPEGSKRVTAQGMGRELSRAGFRRACNGAAIKTETAGQMKVWVIRDEERVHEMKWGRVGELYDKERKGATQKPKRGKYK